MNKDKSFNKDQKIEQSPRKTGDSQQQQRQAKSGDKWGQQSGNSAGNKGLNKGTGCSDKK